MMGSAAHTNKQKEEGKQDLLGGVRAGIETEKKKKKSKRKAVCCLGLISKQSCDLLYCSQNYPKQVLRQLVKRIKEIEENLL